MVGRPIRNGRNDRRRLERWASRGDIEAQARFLAERMARGDLSKEQVGVASRLGDPRAHRLEPLPYPYRWVRRDIAVAIGSAALALGDRGKILPVAFAVDCADRVSHLCDDPLALTALESARRWLLEPSLETIGAARDAGHAALASDIVSGRTSFHAAFRATLNAAMAAAYAPLNHPSMYAASAAAEALDAAEDAGGEEAWQRARLAAYVLGEINPRGRRT